MDESMEASTASMEVVYLCTISVEAASKEASTEVVEAFTGSLEYFHIRCRHPCGSNFPGSFGLLPWKLRSLLP